MNIDLEDILINSHGLYDVWAGECDFSPQVECSCHWKGDPRDYGLHLLCVLGFEDKVIMDWRRMLGRPHITTALKDIGKVPLEYSEQQLPEVTPIQREDYLNIYRDPKNKRKITKQERKAGTLAE